MPPLTLWLVLPFLVLLAAATTSPTRATTVASSFHGQREFDYFAFALQWPGTYCKRTRSCCPTNGCCRGSNFPTVFTIREYEVSTRVVVVEHLLLLLLLLVLNLDLMEYLLLVISTCMLDGLWPDYNDGTWPSCCSGSSFDPKEILTLTNSLEQYWPSLSCSKPSLCHGGKGTFWAHESVLNDAGYVPSNTEKYPLGGIISAIENAFHASPQIVCSKDSVEELRLCFYKDFQPRDCALGSDIKINMVTSKKSCPKYVSLPEPVSVRHNGLQSRGYDDVAL
ncbi:hypothetical protein JHK82_017673 [Glycine max]|nr:hypothetical protein JHK82_017673 [Glycine max]